MGEDLSEWVKYTAIQGDPSRYSKLDVEIGAKRLFDAFNFRAGKSNKDRRRSFEELWEESNSNPHAVAYGFEAALQAKVYSLAYVKACIRGFCISPPVYAPPKVPRRAPESTAQIAPPSKPRKKAKVVEPEVKAEDIEWK